MTVRTRDNKVTKVLVMMDRVLHGIKGDDQGAEDRKEVRAQGADQPAGENCEANVGGE